MRHTTHMLHAEHQALKGILALFEERLRLAHAEGEVDPESFAPLLAFFEDFVDGLHQEKEERWILPRLRARAATCERALMDRLLEEHHGERGRLQAMRERFEGAAYGDPFSLDAFLADAVAYARAQRSHLRAEETWLLPRMERWLTEEDDLWLVTACRHLEHERKRPFLPTAEALWAAWAPRTLHGSAALRAA